MKMKTQEGMRRPRSIAPPMTIMAVALGLVGGLKGWVRCKDKLEEVEEKIWDPRTSDAGGAKGVDHSKVVQVTNEGTCGMRKGQRVAPKEPLQVSKALQCSNLKRDDRYAHTTLPDEC